MGNHFIQYISIVFYWKSRNPIAFAFWLFFTSFHKSHLIYCVSNYLYTEFVLANITKPIHKQNPEFETLLCQLWIFFEKLWITIKLLWKRRKVWELILWYLVHCTVLRLESLGTIHLRRRQIFTIFDPSPPTIGILAKWLWRGFLILMYCDLWTIGT